MQAPISFVLAIVLASSSMAQDDSHPVGFDSLGQDPYAVGLFEDLTVIPGPPSRIMTRTLHGTRDGQSFVNVTRLSDARRFRNQLISIRLPVRLDAPTMDTSARLWVRVGKADGTVGFTDLGLDSATCSSQWTTLTSTGAVAPDATDLWFGLIVEGPTPVHLEGFQLEVLGEVAVLDSRHAVPERWTKDPSITSVDVFDSELGMDLRVTTFRPPGHNVQALPHLWLMRHDADLRRSYEVGRGLVEAMRVGQDPSTIVTIVQPRMGALPASARTGAARERIEAGLRRNGSVQPAMGEAVVALCGPGSLTPVLLAGPGDSLALPESAVTKLRSGGGARDEPWAERVLLRWAGAQHDAAGDPLLADLLFDASLMALEPRVTTSAVGANDHSLTGHQCDHDHDHVHHH